MKAWFNTVRGMAGLRWLLDNPLYVREFRRRMRGKLFTWSLIGYLIALGGVSAFIMLVKYTPVESNLSLRQQVSAVREIGPAIFAGMCVVEGIIALFIAPMLTSGLATAEKEKDTFDFLRVTTLHSYTFIMGCLLITGSFLLLIFSCTLPILALSFIFGGVSMSNILVVNLMMFLLAITISTLGIAGSASFRKGRAVRGVSATFLVIVGIFLAPALLFNVVNNPDFNPSSPSWVGGAEFAMFAVIPPILLTLLLSIIAMRRLYDPNNRMFNYRQFLIMMGLILGGISSFVIMNAGPGGLVPLDTAGRDALLQIFNLTGWGLCAFGVLTFSCGRPERGDEVWRLRMAVPIFRHVDERIFIFPLMAAIWIGGYMFLTGEVSGAMDLPRGILPGLCSLAMAWALCHTVSIWQDDRNKAFFISLLALFLVWFVFPMIGANIDDFAKMFRLNGSGFIQFVGGTFQLFSPIIGLFEKNPKLNAMVPMVGMLCLTGLLLIPTLKSGNRRAFRMDYTWTRNLEEDLDAVR